MPVYKNSSGSTPGGTWTQLTHQPRQNNSGATPGGSWGLLRKCYKSSNYHYDSGSGLYVCTWTLLEDWTNPAGISVPGVAIAKRPATQITYGARVTWTVITDPNDDRYNWSVQVNWYNNTQNWAGTGSTLFVDNHPAQSDGSSNSPQGAQLDQVYATVLYYNANGSGTVTTTSNVILGP